MKRLLLLILLFQGIVSALQAQRPLYLDQRKFTDILFTTRQLTSPSTNCYKFYKNDVEMVRDQDYTFAFFTVFNGGGIYHINTKFGFWAPGDRFKTVDVCAGITSDDMIVGDDFVYIEVPSSSSQSGNNISATDNSPPYSRLSTPVNVGKCEPLTIGSHVLFPIRFGITYETNRSELTTGVFKVNGSVVSAGDYNFSNGGVPNVVGSLNASGSLVTDGSLVGTSKSAFTGATPISLEYQHNGSGTNVGDLFMGIGGMRIRSISNAGFQLNRRNFLGEEVTDNFSGDYTNANYKITFDENRYSLFVNDAPIATLERFVVYESTTGTISNTANLPYKSTVTFTPSASGESIVTALIDGAVKAFQYFNVAEDMVINESTTNVTCNGESTGSVTINVTGGQGAKSYSKDGTTYQTSNVIGGLAANNYTIYVRDASGCVAQKSISIGENSVLVPSATANNANCTGESNGSVNVGASGGAGFYQYRKGTEAYGTNSTFTGLAAGTYTFFVKDAAGCEKSIQATVGTNSTLNASVAITPIICFGASTGQLVTTTSGNNSGTVQYSLNDTDYQTGNTFAGLTANTYTVYVKDNLCKITLVDQQVTQNTEIDLTDRVNTSAVSCNGLLNGSIVINPTGGVGGYVYSLDGTNYTGTATNTYTYNSLGAGNFKVWVRDTEGCIKESGIVSVSQPNVLVAGVASKVDVLCNGLSTGSATLTATEGTAPYKYAITGFTTETNATISNLEAGNYSFVVEDANGCTAQTSAEIIQPTAISALTAVTATVSCFGGNNGQLTVTASGGTGTLTYANGTGTYQTQPVFNTLTSGDYTISVKDANGCVAKADPATIAQPDSVHFIISLQKNVLCFGGNTGEITLSASGGEGNFLYSKDSIIFSSGTVFSNFVIGEYSFFVKDGSDCPKKLSTTITQPPNLVVSLAKTQDVLCFAGNTGKITTIANGGVLPYQYALDGGAYVSQSVANSHLIDTLTIGTYQVRVRDTNGCVKTTNQVTIEQPTDIIPSITANVPVNCFGESDGSVTIGATGGKDISQGYTYSKNGEAAQTNPTFNGLSQGSYVFTVRDVNDCPKNIAATVGQPAAPYTLTLTSSTNLSCYQNNTGVIEVANAGGNGGYQVSKDNSTFQASTTFGGLAQGGYTIYGRDTKGCSAQVSGITLTEPSDISITLLSKQDVDCDYYSRGEALVRATGSNGGFSYTLSGADFRSDPIVPVTNTSGKFEQLKSGSYTLTATDVRACAKNFTVAIDSKSSTIGFNISKSLPTSCLATDGTITVIDPNGGRNPLTFNISTQSSFTTNPSFENLRNGNYIVTVADSLCSYKQDVDLRLPNSINAGYTISPISCTTPDANLSVSPITGGNGNYELSLNGGGFSNSNNFNNLAPNVYSILVKDNPLSCETVLSIEVKEQNRSDLEFTNRTNILCFGNNTGQIAVRGNNNLAPFTYALNSGGFGSDGTFPNLTIGTYKLYSRNRIGCVDSLQATLTEPPLLVNTTTKNDNLCFSDNSGKLFVNATGGVNPYEYSIDNVAYKSANSFEGLIAGNYTTYLKDAHGCVTPQAVTLSQPTDIVVNPQYIDTVRCFNESNGKVLVLASGGTPGYQYSMNNSAYFGSDTFQDLPKGAFTFYVKDANQCVRQKELTLTEPPLLELSLVNKVDPLCFESKDGIIELKSVGGNGGNAYEVTNFQKQGNPAFTILPQDNYVATVTDRRGCQAFVSDISLTQPTKLQNSFATIMPKCFGESNGRVTISVSEGTPGYRMQVDGQTYEPSTDGRTFVFDNIGSREYNFSTIDKNGCLDPFTVNLPQPSALKNRIVMTENKCNGDSTGTLQVFGEGATPPYRYALQNSYRTTDTTFVSENFYDRLLAKSYVVRTKDANNCLLDVNYEVTQPTKVQFSPFYADTVRCFGEANGKVKLLATGGTPTYLYSLDNTNFQSSDTLKGLKAGDYSFYVKDQNNCPADPLKSFAVTEPKLLELAVSNLENPLCLGERNGSITLSVAGGNGGYQFIRDNSFKQNTLRFTNLSQGEYTFKVTDRRTCEDTVTLAKLKWPEGLTAKITTTTPVCFGEENGKITLSPTGGVGGYKAQLQGTTALFEPINQANELMMNKMASGNYTVSLNDQNGCQLTLPVNVKAAEKLLPFLLGGDLRKGNSVVVCKGQNVVLNVNNSAKNINWYLNNTELLANRNATEITVKEAGIYKAEISNPSGCKLSDTFELQNNPFALNADFLIPTQAFVGDTVVCLDITKPIPDRVVWVLPNDFFTISTQKDKVTFVPNLTGEKSVRLIAESGECRNTITRIIKIFDKDNTAETDTSYFFKSNALNTLSIFPNPNYGNFNLTVDFNEKVDFQVQIVRITTGESIYNEKFETKEIDAKLRFSKNLSFRTIGGIYSLIVTVGKQQLFKNIAIIN